MTDQIAVNLNNSSSPPAPVVIGASCSCAARVCARPIRPAAAAALLFADPPPCHLPDFGPPPSPSRAKPSPVRARLEERRKSMSPRKPGMTMEDMLMRQQQADESRASRVLAQNQAIEDKRKRFEASKSKVAETEAAERVVLEKKSHVRADNAAFKRQAKIEAAAKKAGASAAKAKVAAAKTKKEMAEAQVQIAASQASAMAAAAQRQKLLEHEAIKRLAEQAKVRELVRQRKAFMGSGPDRVDTSSPHSSGSYDLCA